MPVHLCPWHARYGHTHLHTNVNTRTRTCVHMCTHTRLHRHTQAQEHSITSKTMPDKKRSKWQGPFYQWLFALSNTDRSSELYFLFVRQPITHFLILQWSLYLHQIKGVLVWFGLLFETRTCSGCTIRTRLPPPASTPAGETTGERMSSALLIIANVVCLHTCAPLPKARQLPQPVLPKLKLGVLEGKSNGRACRDTQTLGAF